MCDNLQDREEWNGKDTGEVPGGGECSEEELHPGGGAGQRGAVEGCC